MNQTATWDKIWNSNFFNNQFLHFRKNHFTDHHFSEILRGLGRLLGFQHYQWKNIYRVQIRIGQKTVEAMGLYDTGNSLYEPIRHQPVSIVEKRLIQELLDDEEWQTRLRMIPYRSIGVHCGLMRGFVADEIRIFVRHYPVSQLMPVLAVANQPFGQADGCQVILHPDLF